MIANTHKTVAPEAPTAIAEFSISAINIQIGYEETLLEDVSLMLTPGKAIAMSGKVGSGKSSLLKVLGLLEPPQAGKVYFGQLDCDNLNRSELDILIQRYIAYIFQTPELMMDWTAAENISLALMAKGYTGFYVGRKLLQYGEILDIKALLRSKIPAHKLSGGEKQLVSIARALAQRPEMIDDKNIEPFFLIADEPTSSLDKDRQGEVIEKLIEMTKAEQIALVMATHEDVILDKFDNRFYIQDKQLKIA